MSMMSLVTRLVETVEQKIVGLEDRVFDRLLGALGSAHARMTENWEGRIKAMESRVASLESAADSHAGTTTEVATQLGDLSQTESLEQRLRAAFAPAGAVVASADPGPEIIADVSVAEDPPSKSAVAPTVDASEEEPQPVSLAA